MHCCDDPKFDLVEELGHTEGVDWDLGTCPSCGSYVLRSWSEHSPLHTFHDKLTPDEGTRFKQSEGRARIVLLKQWYDDH
ncbi:MAG: hypothetical protein M3N49_06145 [Candidatus Eremiobacteraeota bacterium]|nr:hypothetical protein [Candidatus Eremiobacteraeota bacterium]